MTTTIQKWGNSLAVRIPKEFTKSLKWSVGAVVGFQKIGDKIILTPSRRVYTIEDALKKITKKDLHKIIFPENQPRGKEIW